MAISRVCKLNNYGTVYRKIFNTKLSRMLSQTIISPMTPFKTYQEY